MKAAERPLSERENAAWRAFYEMQELLRGRLEQHLQADSGLSNADYTVLVALSEAPHGQQRAYELSRRLAWEKSRLHHQLTRMCGRGLVERLNGDGRAVYVAITPEGRAALEAAQTPPPPARPAPVPRSPHPRTDRPARRHLPHDPRRPRHVLTPTAAGAAALPGSAIASDSVLESTRRTTWSPSSSPRRGPDRERRPRRRSFYITHQHGRYHVRKVS